jgi:hypothetical protein
MGTSMRRERGFRFAAIAFFLSAVLWGVKAVLAGTPKLDVPIGLSNLALGFMFLVLSRRGKQPTA